MREPSNSPRFRAEGVGKAVTPTGHHVLIKKTVVIRVKHSSKIHSEVSFHPVDGRKTESPTAGFFRLKTGTAIPHATQFL